MVIQLEAVEGSKREANENRRGSGTGQCGSSRSHVETGVEARRERYSDSWGRLGLLLTLSNT